MPYRTWTGIAIAVAIAMGTWPGTQAAQCRRDAQPVDAFVVIDRATLLPGAEDIELRWHMYRPIDAQHARGLTNAYVFERDAHPDQQDYCVRIEPDGVAPPHCVLGIDGGPPKPVDTHTLNLVAGGYLGRVPAVAADDDVTLHFEIRIDDPRYRDISSTIHVRNGSYGQAALTIRSVAVPPRWMEWLARVRRIGWVGVPLAICLLLSMLAAARLLRVSVAYLPGPAQRVAADPALPAAAPARAPPRGCRSPSY